MSTLTDILDKSFTQLIGRELGINKNSYLEVTEKAIKSYIAEVIGEDDVYSELSAEELSHRMKLRAEQRQRAGLKRNRTL